MQNFDYNCVFKAIDNKNKYILSLCVELLPHASLSKAVIENLLKKFENTHIISKEQVTKDILDIISKYIEFIRKLEQDSIFILMVSNSLFDYSNIPSPKRIYYMLKILLKLRDQLLASSPSNIEFYISVMTTFLGYLLNLKTLKSEDVRLLYYTIIERIMFLKRAELLFDIINLFIKYIGKTKRKNDNLNLLMIPIRFLINILPYKQENNTYKMKSLTLINFLLKEGRNIEIMNNEVLLECSDSLYLHIYMNICNEISNSSDVFSFVEVVKLKEYDLGLILQYLQLSNPRTIGLEFLLLEYISPILTIENTVNPSYYKIIKRLNDIKNSCGINVDGYSSTRENQDSEQRIYKYISELTNNYTVHKNIQNHTKVKSKLRRVEQHNYDVLIFSFFQYVMENESNSELYIISYVIKCLTEKRVTLPEDYSDLLNFTIIKHADKPGSFKEFIKERLESTQRGGTKALKLYLDFGMSLYTTIRSLKNFKNSDIIKFKFFLLGDFKHEMFLDILSNVFINLMGKLYLMKYADFAKASFPILDFFKNTDVDSFEHIKLASECINNIFMLFIQPIDMSVSNSDLLNVADLVAIKLNSRSSLVNDVYLQRNSVLIFLKKLLSSFDLIGWSELNLKYKRYYWAYYLAEMYVIYEKLLDSYDFSAYQRREDYIKIRMVCEKKLFQKLLTDSTISDKIDTLRLEYQIKEEDDRYLQLWFSGKNPPIMKNYIYRESYQEEFVQVDNIKAIHKVVANFVFSLGGERTKNPNFVSNNGSQLMNYINRISFAYEQILSKNPKSTDLLNTVFLNSFIAMLKQKVELKIGNSRTNSKKNEAHSTKIEKSNSVSLLSDNSARSVFQDILDDLSKPIFDLILENDIRNIHVKYSYLSGLNSRNIELIIFYSKTFMGRFKTRNIISNIAMMKILNNKLKTACEFLFNPFWNIQEEIANEIDSSIIFNLLVKASLLWTRKEFSKAIEINFKTVSLLKNVKNKDKGAVKKFLAMANTILATRSFEKQSISYEDCDELFKQGVRMLDNNDMKLLYFVKTNYKIFLSQLLNRKEKLFLSSEWLKKRELVKQKKSMIESTRAKYKAPARNASRAETEFYSFLSKATLELKTEIITLNKETAKQENDKIKLMELMCECIILEQNNSSQMVFELVNLWFENQNKITSLTQIVYKYIFKEKIGIASYKLIPVIKQLVSKLSTLNVPLRHDKKDTFSTVLYKVCLGVISEHPFQTIQLFIPLRTKNQHCEDLLNSLLMTKFGKHIKMYVETADFYIELTEDTFKKKLQNGKVVCMSPKMEEQTKKLRGSILYTADVPVVEDSNYSEDNLLPYTIDSINREMQTSPSGITRPLILKLKTVNGEYYKQLLKSNDDMRQDSCVQLLFKSLNKFISFNQIRTYNALPINSSIGVIEWLNDVVSYSSYIETAQKVYKGKGNELRGFREKMSKTTSKPKLLEVYKDILKKMKPTMRYFFLENFNTPKSYILARHNYLVSTAVTSLIGYIVGIGDRHNENIMIDKSTGESVHIDFGIMFGQGEALKIPEQVPFRLTPEMTDGLGVLAVNSGFKIYMEETLKSLKTNKQIIMTVLKVLTNDPINKWMLSNKIIQEKVSRYKKLKMPTDNKQEFKFTTTTGDNLNINAEQMLNKVNDKLDGNIDFVHYSTSGLVNKLIVDATNQEFLSQMFCGWASWL